MSEILNYLRSYRQIAPLLESDGALLQRFRLQRDEFAFATLVQRHGPLVLGIARRALGQIDAADDVFQATFLILARRSRQLETWPSVAGWLVQVARRTALQARSKATRRARHEQQAATMTSTTVNADPAQTTEQQDLVEMLDAELARLPSKYRTPLILCQLQGQTREETARQLGCPVGSVSGRLARGKKLLQERLIRRGLMPSLVAGVFTIPHLEAQVPSLLIQATTLLATNIVHQSSNISTSTAVTLAQGVMASMLMNKLKYAAITLCTITLCLGTGAWAWSGKIKLAAEQVQTPKQDVKSSSLLEQLQGSWAIETAIEGRDFQQGPLHTRVSHNYKFWTFRGREFLPGSEANLKWEPGAAGDSFQLDESTVPAQWTNFSWHCVIKIEEGKIYLNMALKSKRDRPKDFEPADDTVLLVLHRFSDYDRLEGVWRKEEYNPVTNELTKVEELIFKKNMYVRRKFFNNTHTEDPPQRFLLNETTAPKQLDWDIEQAAILNKWYQGDLSTRDNVQKDMFVRTIAKEVSEGKYIERRLGIYELTPNEFKYVVTGAVPFALQNNEFVVDAKSSLKKRPASFSEQGITVHSYQRVLKSLKDSPASATTTLVSTPDIPPRSNSIGNPSGTTPPATPSPQLQALRQKRLELAQERMVYWTKIDDRKNELWKEGRSGPIPPTTSAQICEISKQLLEAKLALAQDQPSRVMAMREHLKVLKKIEKEAEQRCKQNEEQPRQGASGLVDTLKDQFQVAQLRRVEFEIQLEELKNKP